MTTSGEFPALISPDELAELVRSGESVVLDCRFNLAKPEAGEAAFQSAHIPGAAYAHLDRDLASPRGPGSGRHPLPGPAGLSRIFSSWGIDRSVRVVAYDDAGGAIAARLWWLLRWMGHPQVALLDGGWNAWTETGMPVSTATPDARQREFQGRAGQMPVMETEEIASRLTDENLLIIDARAPARYLGQVEPIDPVAGHIPGAVNLPYQDNLTESGRFRDRTILRQNIDAIIGHRTASDTVVMCGSGVTACHNLFSMELAGLSGACLYPGSWSEWIADPRRPVSQG